MKNTKVPNTEIECNCGCSKIDVSDWGDSYTMTLYAMYPAMANRIVAAWNILLHGSGVGSEIVLEKEDVRRLADFLYGRINETHRTPSQD